MPTSGTYLWSPDLAECVDEAFERCKVDPSSLSVGHVLAARRSMRFMFVEWATRDFHGYRVDRLNDYPLVQGTAAYTIDPDADGRIIDVMWVSLRRSGTDTTIYPMSRQEWFDIPEKTTQGRPSRYFADKRQDMVDVTLWTVPENSTDTLLMDVIRKPQDSVSAQDEPDIPFYMREAFAAGLAYRLGAKFAPEPILPRLKGEAVEEFNRATGSQRELGDIIIVPGSGQRYSRGGRR